MTDNDKKEFALMLKIVCQSYSHREFEKDTLRYWYSKLECYEFNIVSKAFDTWIDTSKQFPTVKDIVELCKPKPTIFARLPSPLAIAENHRHASEVKEAVDKMTKGNRDMKDWARRIKANPSAYPEISLRYANEALGLSND